MILFIKSLNCIVQIQINLINFKVTDLGHHVHAHRIARKTSEAHMQRMSDLLGVDTD